MKLRYLTQITYLFPQVAARQCRNRQRSNARIGRAAMRGSSADLYNLPWMNAEAHILDWRRVSIVESLQSCYRWGSIQWSAILSHTYTLLFLYLRISLKPYKTGSASQATSRHKWLSPFSARIRAEFLSRFFRAVSCRKFARYRAENPCGIRGKSERVRADIHVRPRWKFEEFFGKM